VTIRALGTLVLAVCLAAPVLAQQSNTQRSDTMMMQQGTVIRDQHGGVRGGISPIPVYERGLPNAFYREQYRLTPREYTRLRAQGFSPKEVYMIANASRVTGLPTRTFADAIYRGLYARQISIEYGIDPYQLTRVNPEWQTREWATMTGAPPIRGEKLDVWW
jgi:hypothetical protein